MNDNTTGIMVNLRQTFSSLSRIFHRTPKDAAPAQLATFSRLVRHRPRELSTTVPEKFRADFPVGTTLEWRFDGKTLSVHAAPAPKTLRDRMAAIRKNRAAKHTPHQ